MKTVADYQKDSYEFSGKASDISRQLAFGAIAVIWLFKTDTPTGYITIPPDRIWPGILIVAALAADLLQYVAGSSGLLCSLSRKKANWLVLPIWGLFEIKMALVIGAYILILLFLIPKLGLVH